ncbi:phosphotransferase family protein [Xylariaceae sp. FL1651]|nr:phosphotransferase family protein [Xylariaceae sp. FL1651]
MPSKPRFLCMEKDDLVWQKLDEATNEWDISIRTKETYRAVANLILKYKEGQTELMHPAVKGGYNVVYRLEYKDGSSAIMRIPIRVRYEVATMRYVAANTTIPVPHVYYYGTAADNPIGLGRRAADQHPILNPDVSEEELEFLYSQIANILLQLSSLKFPRIGSLVEKEDGISTSVEGRPLTMNMSDLIVHTNTPASILPSQTYASADEWYKALADMHIIQLAFQRNDAVEDEGDARVKYRRLASELESDGGFTLFSEDFRPANILLDKDLRIVSVIDWEFAYAAPTQFSFDPPWWLLLEEPGSWTGGYHAWMEVYEPRLRTFLRALEAEEKKMTAANIAEKVGRMSLAGGGKTEVPLSQRMRESWEKRTWMRNYAARKSWAFDFVWWKFLDESYPRPNENQDYHARLELLSGSQRELMEAFVACKMEESRNPGIIEWEDKRAADRLAELLV